MQVVARQLHGEEEVLDDDVEDGAAGEAVGAGAGDGLLDVLEDALEVVELAAGGAKVGACCCCDFVYVAPESLGQEFPQEGSDDIVIHAIIELDKFARLGLAKLKNTLCRK